MTPPLVLGVPPVQFASDDYFALIAAKPDLGAALALGERVIVVSDGVAYEVINGEAPPLVIPPTTTPEPATTAQPASTATPFVTDLPPVLVPTPTPAPRGGSGGSCFGSALAVMVVAFSAVIFRRAQTKR